MGVLMRCGRSVVAVRPELSTKGFEDKTDLARKTNTLRDEKVKGVRREFLRDFARFGRFVRARRWRMRREFVANEAANRRGLSFCTARDSRSATYCLSHAVANVLKIGLIDAVFELKRAHRHF